MKAAILLIGTELLNGATLDTNSIYIAEELNKLGIEIKYKLVLRDFEDEIIEALNFANKNVDLIITSGGLGPTDDDITKEAIAKFLNKKLIVDEKDLEVLLAKFRKINSKILPSNHKEIEKFENSIIFDNDVGMAPAVYTENIVCFPGVPSELKNLLPKFLAYYKKEKNIAEQIYIKDILTFGMGESILENTVKDLFTVDEIYYEFLVKDYATIIRFQSKLSKKNDVEKILKKVYNKISGFIFGEDEDRLEELVYKELKENNFSIALAESCTGGLLASKLVNVAGISEFFKEGIVAYSNDAKIKRLGIKEETLKKYGAVSEEVAREMLERFDTDVAISTTGIAGPGGGTKDKPVGLVYIAIKIKDKIIVERKTFHGERSKVRERTTTYALFKLLKEIRERKK